MHNRTNCNDFGPGTKKSRPNRDGTNSRGTTPIGRMVRPTRSNGLSVRLAIGCLDNAWLAVWTTSSASVTAFISTAQEGTSTGFPRARVSAARALSFLCQLPPVYFPPSTPLPVGYSINLIMPNFVRSVKSGSLGIAVVVRGICTANSPYDHGNSQ